MSDSGERAELRGLITLALPLIAGFVGNQLMGFVDTAMVGRLGPAAIGGVGIGNGIYLTIGVFALGCPLGMDPLVAKAIGAGEHAHARRLYWQGLRVALFVSVALIAEVIGCGYLVEPFGVKPAIAAATRAYLWGRAWNLVPLALFGAARSYLQANDLTRPIVISTIVANIANFFADAILIYGDRALHKIGLPGIGLPALGPVGAGIASSLSATAALAILFHGIGKVAAPPDPDRRRYDRALLRAILKLGLPIGAQLTVEVCAFSIAAVLSGRISPDLAAANQVALTLASMTFMVPLGIASATAVRVAQALGRGDRPMARRAGLSGFGLSLTFMAGAAVAFLVMPGPLARVLTNQHSVILAAIPLIQIAAVFQLSDATQVTGAGALRGLSDTHTALYANVVGHFVIGIPLAILLCFGAKLGGPGLWWGLSAGLTVVAIWLGLRFLRVSRVTP